MLLSSKQWTDLYFDDGGTRPLVHVSPKLIQLILRGQ